jgi:hypothetical protein
MSLFRNLLGGGRMKDPVRGIAQVASATAHHGDGVWQNCRMNLVVQGEGIEPTAVEHSGIVRRSRWPTPGMVLPVTFDRNDPHRLKVEWDEVGSSRDRSRETAEGMAAAMRGDPAGGAGTPAGSDDPEEDRLARLEKLGQLHAQGVLDDDEFEAEKRRILES